MKLEDERKYFVVFTYESYKITYLLREIVKDYLYLLSINPCVSFYNNTFQYQSVVLFIDRTVYSCNHARFVGLRIIEYY